MSNSVWVAQDGSYGECAIIVIPTSGLTPDEYDELFDDLADSTDIDRWSIALTAISGVNMMRHTHPVFTPTVVKDGDR